MILVFMTAVMLALYLVMVGGNSLAFSYNFWNSPPPSDAADLATNISLAVLYVLESGVLAWAFSTFCVVGLDRDVNARRAIRSAFRSTVRRSWRAVPAMMLTGVGVVLVIGGPPLIAAFAPLAVSDAEPSSQRSRGFGSQYGAHLVISLPITGLAFAAWSVGARLGGVDVPDAVVAVLLLGLAVIAAVFAAWTAFAAAQLAPPANAVAEPR